MGRPNAWTAVEETKLAELWVTNMPARDIGEAIGRNKNQVIARAHRLKLPLKGREMPERRGPQEERRRRMTIRRKPEPKPKPAPVVAEAPPPPKEPHAWRDDPALWGAIPASNPVDILGLQNSQCRWPIGGDLYCGAIKAHGSYCAHHAAIAYTGAPVPASRQAAATKAVTKWA